MWHLSKECCQGLKGIAILLVVLHHICCNTNSLGVPFIGIITASRMGFWAVSLFLFISGYGLRLSYKSKGRKFVDDILLNRIVPFYLIDIFFIILYVVLNLTLSNHHEIDFTLIVQSFLMGKTVISNGWYFQVQLLLYLLFYFVYKTSYSEKKKIVLLVLFVLMYIAISVLFDCDIFWYASTPSFLLGFLWCDIVSKILKVSDVQKQKHKLFLEMILISFYFACLQISRFTSHMGLKQVSSLFISFECIIFLLLTLVALNSKMLLKIVNNNFLRCVGKKSLAVYAIHGAFIDIFRGKIIYIDNNYLFATAVIISTAIATILLSPLLSLIFKMFKKKEKCNA